MTPDALQFPDLGKVFPDAEEKPVSIPRRGSGGAKVPILIADEDPIARLALFQFLAAAGYEVIVAEDGNEAIAELRKPDCPPVAILGWGLPGLSGLEICTRMRGVGKAVYLLLSSENGGTRDLVAGLDAGADGYLPKPIENEVLLAYVKAGLRIVSRQRTLEEELEELSVRGRRDR